MPDKYRPCFYFWTKTLKPELSIKPRIFRSGICCLSPSYSMDLVTLWGRKQILQSTIHPDSKGSWGHLAQMKRSTLKKCSWSDESHPSFLTVSPLTVLWASFSFLAQEGSSSTEVTFCLQLWDRGVSPACARENKQNHSRVRRSISRAYKHSPLSFQLFISERLPCCYWQLGECWDTAWTTSWRLLSPALACCCQWHRHSFITQGWQRMLN